MTTTYFKTCTRTDEVAIKDFLWSIREDFPGFDQAVIDETTRSLFEKGGMIAGYKNNQIVALLGYFLGESSSDYQNKDVGFLHLAVLAKSVRMTRVACEGLRFVTETFKSLGMQEMRFYALKTDTYVNRLYSRFAKPQGEALNKRGYPCISYKTSVDATLAYLTGQHRAQAARPTLDTYPQN